MDLESIIGGGTAGAGVIGLYLVYEVRIRGQLLTRIRELESALKDGHRETIECAELRGQVREHRKVEDALDNMQQLFKEAVSAFRESTMIIGRTIPPAAIPAEFTSRTTMADASFFGKETHVDGDTPPEGSPVATAPQTPISKRERGR